jgi:ParB family transcriptional regulator, chromosome partitioning protein
MRKEHFMTTSAAENLAGQNKEKVEKRRALGRGLESLLPGPRVVPGAPAQSGGAPPLRAGTHSVRNDKAPANDSAAHHDGAGPGSARGEAFAGTIRAVVDEAVDDTGAGAPSTVAQGSSAPHTAPAQTDASAELRSGGQPGAAVPTFESSESAGADDPITIYAQAETRMPANLVVNLAIADIDKNPFQTRYVDDDDALEELADSIKVNGVVQPIMVRPGDEEGRYILVLGERRLLASKKAGKTTIPAMVRRLSLQQAAEMTIIENLQREDLSALEQAEAFRVLSKEFSLTQAQIGERVGLSRESVSNYMRLLKLPREVMQLLAEKKITFGEAKELLKLENDDQITQGALYAVKKGLSLEQIERMVLSMNGLLDPFPGMPGQVTKKTGSGARWVDPNVRAAQTDLERMLGVRVRIRDRKGKGKIVIEYSTVDDYERVVEMLRGRS